MNVWLIHQHAIPPDRPGGTRHFSMARELAGQGIHMHIVASNVDYLSRAEASGPEGADWWTEEREGVHFHWIRSPRPGTGLVSRARAMLAFGSRVRKTPWARDLPSPDLIVGSSPSPLAALAGERIARRHGIPFVAEIRDVWPQSLIDIGKLPSYHPGVLLLAGVERRLYARAKRIITLLPGAATHIDQVVPGSGEKTRWIPNGVDTSLFPDPPDPPDPDPLVLMYAGAHGRANGLDTILDAARLLEAEAGGDTLRFVLLGDGPEKGRLQERARVEGLRSVVFEPPVPKKQMMAQLARAHGFLMVLRDSPVFRWGISPNKLFDYMMMGRPVIFAVGTPFNPVHQARSGVSVPPEDPRALADAVHELMSMTAAERSAMGRRGRAWVSEHHDISALARRFGEVLREARGETPEDYSPNSSR